MTNPSPVQPTADLIDRCTALRDLSREALLSALGASSADVQSGLAYGPTTALDMVYKPATSPCRVYLQGDKVLLVYLGEEALAGISPAALVKRFPPELSLASRAGKVFQHHIAASAGVAWSDDGTELALLELFAPTSLEDFQSRFYTAPGPFIK